MFISSVYFRFPSFCKFPSKLPEMPLIEEITPELEKNNTQLESDEQAKQRRLEEAESQTQRGSGDGGSNSQSTSLQIEDVTDNKLSGKAHRQKLINKTFCQKLIILINFKKK